MFQNYLTVAIRNLLRNKAFTAINLFGLILGMTCSLLIFLWIRDERSYDTFFAHNERLYTIHYDISGDGFSKSDYFTPCGLPAELERKLPDIQFASGLYLAPYIPNFQKGKTYLKENGGFASPHFFQMFDYKLLRGSAANALTDISCIAISRKIANKYFGSPEAAFDQTIHLEHPLGTATSFKVAAVFEDIPPNASRKFDFLINWKALEQLYPDAKSLFYYYSAETYILLTPGARPEAVQAKIEDFVQPYEPAGKKIQLKLGMVPFDQMYLINHFDNGKPSGGRIEYIQIFTLIAIFVLLIACINFMNLTTARSAKRAKEVGIRKTVGALRSKLIVQFMGEAILICLFAALIAVLAAALLLPSFNTFTGKALTLPPWTSSFWYWVLLIVLTTGLVSGSYPALFLSALDPVTVLKGSLTFSWSAVWFRKGLVIFQFTLAIILTVGAITIARQVGFIQSRDLGFDKQDLIYMPVPGDLAPRYDAFKKELLRIPGIQKVTHCDGLISDMENNNTPDIEWPGKKAGTTAVSQAVWAGEDYPGTLGLKLIAGRDFSHSYQDDSANYIINEQAMAMLGYSHPIGQRLAVEGKKGKIIGLLKDFNYGSLQVSIHPLIIMLAPIDSTQGGYILIRTEPGRQKQAIAGMQKLSAVFNPGYPFTYRFCDEEFASLYRTEQLAGKLADSFGLLAILISCLGLLGLAMYSVGQRAKEIGIRKVLGASAFNIVLIFSRDSFRLVLASALIACPIAWVLIRQWLHHFAYRISIDAWLFVDSALLALLIAILTTSFQAVKAAIANPVKSLKTE
jgi:putative ABC transport system permease protein